MCAEYWEWSWVHWNHKQILHPKCKFLHCFFYVTCTPRELWVVVSVGKWTFTKKICSTQSQRKWINASSHMGRVVVGEQRPRPVDDASCLEWAVDIIHSAYYIHGPWRAKKNFCCFICVSYGPYTLLQNDSFFYIYIWSFSTKFILRMYIIAQAYLQCCKNERKPYWNTTCGLNLVIIVINTSSADTK